MKAVVKLIEIRTLVAGLFPVLLGSVYSWYQYKTMNWLFLIGLVIAIGLIQASTNMWNDFMDFRRGEDEEREGEEKALVNGDINPKQIPFLIGSFLVISCLIGIFIASQTSFYILAVGVTGAAVAYFYSSGPKPISYTPFGELAAGITMGVGITSTVVFIQAGSFHWESIGMAIPTTIYIAAILFTNNVCDREKDLKAGRHTLPGIIGFQSAKLVWIQTSLFLEIGTIVLVCFHIYPVWSLITIAILFSARKIYQMKDDKQEDFVKSKMMGIIGKIGMQYHILLICSLIVAYFMEQVGI